jgi:hypothetical protein
MIVNSSILATLFTVMNLLATLLKATSINNYPLAPKSRITNAGTTVALTPNIVVRQERAVFVPALTFLLLFVSRQKVKTKAQHGF